MDNATINNDSEMGTEMDAGLIVLDVYFWERIILCIIVGLIAVVGIVGNVMIILAVLLSKTLQNPTNAFVTSLSIADLLTSLSLIWFIVSLASVDGWPLPRANWICQLTGFLLFACVGTSIYNLGAIALNRLILITKPFLYKRIFKSWKLVLMVAIPWVVPFGSIIIILATGNGAVGYSESDQTCTDIESHERSDVFSRAQLLIGFPIPLAAILISYIWIYVYLKKHFRSQKDHINANAEIGRSTTPSNETLSSDIEIDSEEKNGRQKSQKTQNMQLKSTTNNKSSQNTNHLPSMNRRKKISDQQIQITKNLFLVVCAFFFCFSPLFILNPVADKSAVGFHIKFYFQALVYGNSAMNFMIYALKHPTFKVVFGHILRLSFSEIPKPSNFLLWFIRK